MTKQQTYTFIAASLAFLIPFPGRFVYGVVLALELIFLMLIGTCVTSVAEKIKLGELRNVLTLIALTSFTIFYKEILILTQTEIAMTLGFLLYIPAGSSFLIGYVFNKTETPLTERLKVNMIYTGRFVIFALFFFLIRDIFGYGTFTFFGSGHMIYEKIIFNPEHFSILSFLATIPGALFLSSLILFIDVTVSHKLGILANADEANKGLSEGGRK